MPAQNNVSRCSSNVLLPDSVIVLDREVLDREKHWDEKEEEFEASYQQDIK
ncbi:hypothetical protein KDH_19010 [Dictyobacter sp. S3.2.2.5]|uniref:Uncharacterized protein n=1 Tax=Dictyobacter halimunensis TaxID=3026934 RepID=A0ABQ6FRK8_9CHLR|nr:hypothetical protein KDH_19010 [Dictyobacter sp. S3.2.2.5]